MGSAESENSVGAAVLGGGPAGLTGAHALAHHGLEPTVFEADGTVGGIAKTVEFGDFRFDLGGHRFYTKLEPVERFWHDVMGDDWLTRERLSRIYYRGRFFNYPLRADDVFRGLGIAESARCAGSYVRWRRRMRDHEPQNFREWVVSRFGKRIYQTFFESYTEKVWGIPGEEIQSEWAAQRIQNFTFVQALLGILGLRRGHATTLIEEFQYPRLGPGQLWEQVAERLSSEGTEVELGHRATAITHAGGRAQTVTVETEGREVEYSVDAVLSTIPLAELVFALQPEAPAEVQEAARKLRYRNLSLVALMIDEPEPFPDNWIYLHDPGTRAGRVQNFGAWSPDMVRPGTTCLGVEYFCFDEDEIWAMSDDEAVALATQELARIGLVDPQHVFDGVKVNVPKAYPMYDSNYREAVAEIRGYLEHFENLRTCGRNGLHRYNNQDHSMWTAVIAARNLATGSSHDVWSVNTKGEYLERQGHLDVELAELGPIG
jgi:protoporphyrinogen oxidase